MDSIKRVAVIIPFYKKYLSDYEAIALEQCFKILSNHAIIAIKPDTLILPPKVTTYSFGTIESFDNKFFKSIQGYNELMLSEEFYSRFLNYEYVLIYQLDAFVFKDELDYWCSQNIDYIGAPWMRAKDYPNIFKVLTSKGLQYLARRFNIKKRNGTPSKKQFDDQVGNGGFSLRRVQIFYDLCIQNRGKIAEYNLHITEQYNEDAFWSIEVNRKRKILNIPGYKKALNFAFEMSPERAYIINNHKLPFGCHAWDLKVEFWRPFFKQYGYTI